MLKEAVKMVLRRSATMVFRLGAQSARAFGLLPARRTIAGSPESFLVVNLTPHVGDTVMLLPMLEMLREAYPQARIECAVERCAAALLEGAPVDKVYALNLGSKPPVRLGPAALRVGRIVREFRKTMPNVAPDVCIMPRWGDDLFRSHPLAYLTGAPRRIGFASNVADPTLAGAPHRDALLTDCVHGGKGLHEAEKSALLLRGSDLVPQGETVEFNTVRSLHRLADAVDWSQLVARLGLDAQQRFAVLAPGASHPKRVWPVDRWCAVAEALKERGLTVVVLSGKQDRALAENVKACSEGVILAAGVTTLRESTALLRHASLFIGADSGPGHIAGALGVPTVTLYIATDGSDPDGPSAPERIHPLGPHAVGCRPPECLLPCVGWCTSEAEEAHCITLIEVEDVLHAVDDVVLD